MADTIGKSLSRWCRQAQSRRLKDNPSPLNTLKVAFLHRDYPPETSRQARIQNGHCYVTDRASLTCTLGGAGWSLQWPLWLPYITVQDDDDATTTTKCILAFYPPDISLSHHQETSFSAWDFFRGGWPAGVDGYKRGQQIRRCWQWVVTPWW